MERAISTCLAGHRSTRAIIAAPPPPILCRQNQRGVRNQHSEVIDSTFLLLHRVVHILVVASALLVAASTARAVPWPLVDTGAVHGIWHAYGQWQEAGGIHLHEGIDLPAAGGTEVKAVQKGTIVNIDHETNHYYDYITVSDDSDSSKGWGYVHVAAKAGLAVGNTVDAGDVLGTISTTAGVQAHLHFERDSDKNGGWPNAGGGTEHLDDDPLLYLNPRTDTVFPTIAELKYRRAEDEGNDVNPKYFTDKCCHGYPIIGSRAPGGESGNVDVIVSAYDVFGASTDHLSVQDIKIHALGRLGDNTPFVKQLVNFEGNGANDFAQQENNNFSELFRDPTLRFAQTIYENDSVANSENEGPFWYIATNQDDDQITERTDDEWFWNTDGPKSGAWNNKLSTDNRAANNAKDKFRDDFYDIYINTRDEANNHTAKVETVLLDNWKQTVATDKFIYWLGETVNEAAGEQHQESDPSVPLYVVDTVVDCADIPSLGIEGSATTTSDGNGILAAPVAVWTASKTGFFWMITDYDDDGIWHPRLDPLDPFVVVRHNYFRIPIPGFTSGPPYPSLPKIVIPVTPTPASAPPIELLQLSLVSAHPVSGPIQPQMILQAHEGSGVPTGEPTTNAFVDVILQTPLSGGLQLVQKFEVLDAAGLPGTLVDLGDGRLFDLVVTPNSFQLDYEVLITSYGPQFWLLTGNIDPLYSGAVTFAGVDVSQTGLISTDSIFNMLVNLQFASDLIVSGRLFTWNIASGLALEPSALAGDFNRDGIVDSTDYVVWRKGLGTLYTQGDYDVWRSHYGPTAITGAGAGANSAVPEPATLVLLTFAVVGIRLPRRLTA